LSAGFASFLGLQITDPVQEGKALRGVQLLGNMAFVDKRLRGHVQKAFRPQLAFPNSQTSSFEDFIIFDVDVFSQRPEWGAAWHATPRSV